MLTYEQIKELIKSIDSSSLRSFELEDQGFKLKLSKNKEPLGSNIKDSNKISEEQKNITTSETNSNLVNKQEEIKNIDNNFEACEASYNIVKSPLVGTYYSSGTSG